MLDIDQTSGIVYTADGVLEAKFASNFVNNGSYNVDAVYTYADISRKAVNKNSGKAWTAANGEANKVWSSYTETAANGMTDDNAALSNDIEIRVAAPAIKLMSWSTLGEKYMQYKWQEKCIETESSGHKTPAKWAVDNEFKLDATIEIPLTNVYAYYGTMVKELSFANTYQKLGGLINNGYLNISKTGSVYAGGTSKENIYTKATIGGRTQTNPVFTPSISGYTVILTRNINNPVEDHMETLYIETIDCFGHKETVALRVRGTSTIDPQQTLIFRELLIFRFIKDGLTFLVSQKRLT